MRAQAVKFLQDERSREAPFSITCDSIKSHADESRLSGARREKGIKFRRERISKLPSSAKLGPTSFFLVFDF